MGFMNWIGIFPMVLGGGTLVFFAVWFGIPKLVKYIFHIFGKEDIFEPYEEKIYNSNISGYILSVWWLFLIVWTINGFKTPTDIKDLFEFILSTAFLGLLAWVWGEKGHLWALLLLMLMIALINALWHYHLL